VTGVLISPDGHRRCPWAANEADYLDYHDHEWGRELHGGDALFERLCLEAFQAGLSWLTILRRREAFRRAFAGFMVAEMAGYDEHDVERLLADATIIRNRAKITAVIHNARVAADLDTGLDEIIWSYRPASPRPTPRTLADLPATTPESVALATDLKRRGFRFVGPTTAYALMQACGLVNDHLDGCHSRPGCGPGG
jgi:DNA-3-methyladenine glycosylase I